MNLKKHRYHRPEDAAEGTGTSTGSPSAPVAETPPADLPEAPESAATAGPADGDAGHATEQDSEARIASLLDEIGKESAPAQPEPSPTPTASATPSASAATPPADPAKPAPPAAIDLTAPEGLSERANARWAALAERAKQAPVLEQQAAEARQEVAAVRNLVQSSGLDPEEFRGALEMGRLFKSRNPQELQAALQRLDGLRADLSARLGVDAPGIDLLAEYPDLKAKVEGLMLSQEDALEIVRLRRVHAAHQGMEQATQEQTQFRTHVQQAATEMDQILAQRAATPGHDAKMAHVRSYFGDPQRLQSFVTTYRPDQWKAAVLMMYESYTPPMAPAPTPAAAPAPPQPLRPGHVASGHRQASGKPVTADAAVENAWGALGL